MELDSISVQINPSDKEQLIRRDHERDWTEMRRFEAPSIFLIVDQCDQIGQKFGLLFDMFG